MRQIGVGTFRATPRMRELVDEVLESGRISYGPMSREYERRFARLHQSRFAVVSNSGTSSLHVALQALKELHGWEDGDEVITQSCTFVATVNVILHNRLKPVLVDVERDCYGMDPNKLRHAITHRTRAVIPVHLFGQPCNMAAIRAACDPRGISIIEDSCECMFVGHGKGTEYRKVGSWGDVGCFSTYVAHILTTGVGGIATTSSKALAVKMRSLVNHGRDGIYLNIDDDDGLAGDALREVMTRRFNFEAIGHSYRITELEAALALGQLDDRKKIIQARQLNASYLDERLGELDKLQLPARRRHTEHAFMMYPIVYLGGSKWPLCQFLEERGIETREMLRLTDQPCYAGLWDPADYPVAGWLNERGFYIGVHQDLTVEDLDRIIAAFREWFA